MIILIHGVGIPDGPAARIGESATPGGTWKLAGRPALCNTANLLRHGGTRTFCHSRLSRLGSARLGAPRESDSERFSS